MELLYICHPDTATHQKQVSFLNSLTEPQRSEHAQLFRFGNAAIRYHRTKEPTEEDFYHWLEGLPESIRENMTAKGYEQCKSILSLRRHSLERSDVSMTVFVKGLLNEKDFEAWERAGNC